MTEESAPPPTTGHPVVDAALAEFGALDDHAPADHHDRIARVGEVLASVLENREAASAHDPSARG